MASAEKLTITLTADMADMVREGVRAGNYASNSEVIRDALRLWQEREDLKGRERQRQWLRDKIGRSLPDPRPFLYAEEDFAELEARYAEE